MPDVPSDGYDLVVVANRLPVDVSLDEAGEISWTRSPGGLVTALAPVMAGADGAWVGWGGSPGLDLEPFDVDGTHLVPVTLSADDVERYYEGFANDTLWPLYHDVIAPPAFHRQWWEAYQRVNRRFAEAAAAQAARGGTVWVHDYQLQLVPRLLRELRPDLRIGYFHHIPFPPLEIFAQLPWRTQVVEGLLGADLVGFQRGGDAANFVRVVRRLTDLTTRGQVVTLSTDGKVDRHVRAAAFPISIDSGAFDALARTPQVQARAREIRDELGNPTTLLLGVDRLDYTKGIRHRIKAYGELLEDSRLSASTTTLVQVASPSRENVDAYAQLRDEVELLVGRINGDHGQVGHAPVQYLHQSFPMEEMAALYLAADVMLVTALRDGMNLVAKEYVAARSDERGALVLSEFTGAADELTGAVLVNPHDIEGMKDAITYAVHMDQREARKRMRRLRRRVLGHDVAAWSREFLAVLTAVPTREHHV
ncbi:alpha,alpha-trehalose-phosphate synthase (UDP-forming) [Cellulomonas gilvus]|uniref:Alpha,alpha-trehalose-phosphate synthase (UDP-forming) n=1 Tax=Cellulomonas gilvus (strain ATCC 13127 / NRRL B-14078) TaxID=593907 RepID=F8A5B4_CELGA|nr:Alpha,alpha-trehalose-phosphate synthase (UDP-forming) [Cellulomonas gilvus ATCC 13127]